jgi:hypothetical protein
MCRSQPASIGRALSVVEARRVFARVGGGRLLFEHREFALDVRALGEITVVDLSAARIIRNG